MPSANTPRSAVPPATPDRVQKAQKVSLVQVVAEFWGDVLYTHSHRFLTTCPQHPGDSATQLELQGNGAFCWSCGWGASKRIQGIQFVRHVRGCNAAEAVELILNLKARLKDRRPASSPPLADWVMDASREWARAAPRDLGSHAKRLGIRARSLWLMGCVPGPEPSRLFAAMRRSNGGIVGLWQETHDGSGFPVQGSLPAPFWPRDDYDFGSHDPIYLAKGPVNTAALLDLGLHAVGWPEAMWTTDPESIAEIVRGRPAVVVVPRSASSIATVAELCWGLHQHDIEMSLAVLPSTARTVLAWVRDGGDADALEAITEPVEVASAFSGLEGLGAYLQDRLDPDLGVERP